jgi:quinolinate synthase
MGVVGSTSNLLSFIDARVREAVDSEGSGKQRLRFVLGTESGMVTSIVNMVKGILYEKNASDDVEVEIVFPVSSESMTSREQVGDAMSDFEILPGPASGEGCSIEGGCANCPYMKMNSIEALERVLSLIGTDGEALLEGNKPRSYPDLMPDGRSITQAGSTPIVRMRNFSQDKRLPDELVKDIRQRRRRRDVVRSSVSGEPRERQSERENALH